MTTVIETLILGCARFLDAYLCTSNSRTNRQSYGDTLMHSVPHLWEVCSTNHIYIAYTCTRTHHTFYTFSEHVWVCMPAFRYLRYIAFGNGETKCNVCLSSFWSNRASLDTHTLFRCIFCVWMTSVPGTSCFAASLIYLHLGIYHIYYISAGRMGREWEYAAVGKRSCQARMGMGHQENVYIYHPGQFRLQVTYSFIVDLRICTFRSKHRHIQIRWLAEWWCCRCTLCYIHTCEFLEQYEYAAVRLPVHVSELLWYNWLGNYARKRQTFWHRVLSRTEQLGHHHYHHTITIHAHFYLNRLN